MKNKVIGLLMVGIVIFTGSTATFADQDISAVGNAVQNQRAGFVVNRDRRRGWHIEQSEQFQQGVVHAFHQQDFEFALKVIVGAPLDFAGFHVEQAEFDGVHLAKDADRAGNHFFDAEKLTDLHGAGVAGTEASPHSWKGIC